MELLRWVQIRRLSLLTSLSRRLLLQSSELRLKISFLLNENGLLHGFRLLFELSWFVTLTTITDKLFGLVNYSLVLTLDLEI